VLAVGAELKSTVAVAPGPAWSSATTSATSSTRRPTGVPAGVEHLLHLRDVDPELVAHDLHPEYLSTKFAVDLDLPLLGSSTTTPTSRPASPSTASPARWSASPTTGSGGGPTARRGVASCSSATSTGERVGHLAPVGLPGGAAAIREPWRMAVSWACAVLDEDALPRAVGHLDPRWREVAALAASPRTLTTTSAGRLFDAVAALLVGRTVATYEGQAAIELEALARRIPLSAAAELPVEVRTEADGRRVLDPAALVRAVVEARAHGEEPAALAAAFHRGLATATVDAAVAIASTRGLDTAALSGGVFQNARLTALVAAGLEAAGLRVLVHRRVPPNDGGISLGQAAIASR
jgi:hydrogenase maturation protein HypF